MAGVGGEGENSSVQEDDDSSHQALSKFSEMCKRNGISHACQCSEKSCRSLDGKRAKVGRLNGVSKIARSPPSIPALRSRGEKRNLPAESPRNKRRSPKLDKQSEKDR